ncbi:MAG: hypothetical protein JWQ41_640 [Variovorax sp.]|nr:hypothetical protein [Variovorax sp.]
MNIVKTSRELSSQNFSFVPSEEWALNGKFAAAWDELVGSWDRLEADRYMKPGDDYRKRRFCKYRVDVADMKLVELNDFSFYQLSAVNSYAGGLRRDFAPVEPEIRRNVVISSIVRTCLEAINASQQKPSRKWQVYLHQIRINCNRKVFGQPTPEGLHRDGHDFISMHLMKRVGIDGGTSRICSLDGQRLMTVTLRNRMDGFLVNDSALLHGVSQIMPSAADAGHRDMLIIDYNRDE